MSGDHPKRCDEANAEIEREIHAERKFTLADAIGQMAGPGMMNGASPVSGKQEAVAEVQGYLNCHLLDARGALSTVLIRHVGEGKLLLRGFDRPLMVLEDYVRQVLESEHRLKEVVREADVEWGRVFGERPYFEKEGNCPLLTTSTHLNPSGKH